MADEVQGKKPKPIGTPAPNVPKPKQEPASAPKQQLAPKQNAKPLSGAKIQPGSPYKSESTPVGVQQKRFESPKHVDKRVNKMFGETNQPTLGVWNKNNTHPMAKPDQVKMNPNLNYKPTEEQLQAANRKRIMNAGFAPKNWDGKSDIQEPVSSPAPAKNSTPNPFKGNSMPGFEGMDELWDNMMGSAQKVIDNDKEERSKASELFGTDLNKSQEPQMDKENEKSLYGASWKQGEPLSATELDVFNDIGDFYRNNGNVAEDSKLYSALKEKYPGITDEDISNMVYAYELDNDGSKNNKPQSQWDKDNEPGSGVVTKELTDWVRNYLTEQVGPEFADATVSNLHKNANQADWFKQKMKEEFEKGSK